MWKGILLAPVAQEYIFFCYCNGHCKVKIGNELVINRDSFTNVKGMISLEKGKYYDLSVKCYGNHLYYDVKLTWEYPG